MREHFIINVGRQLGSGGRIIGQQIAKDFEIGFYDKEILDLAARESGYKVEMFERNDEHKRFFKGLYYALTSPFCSGLGHNQLTDEALFKFQSDAIRKAAEQRSCLFVGRCADYVLRDYVCSVNIFITSHKIAELTPFILYSGRTPISPKSIVSGLFIAFNNLISAGKVSRPPDF